MLQSQIKNHQSAIVVGGEKRDEQSEREQRIGILPRGGPRRLEQTVEHSSFETTEQETNGFDPEIEDDSFQSITTNVCVVRCAVYR